MRIFVTEEEIVQLANSYLDCPRPSIDNAVHYAEQMNMVFCEKLGMWEDVEEMSMNGILKSLYDDSQGG